MRRDVMSSAGLLCDLGSFSFSVFVPFRQQFSLRPLRLCARFRSVPRYSGLKYITASAGKLSFSEYARLFHETGSAFTPPELPVSVPS